MKYISWWAKGCISLNLSKLFPKHPLRTTFYLCFQLSIAHINPRGEIMFHNSISLNSSPWIGENSNFNKTNILTRTITSNTELQMLSYKTPACITAFNWNCCSMFFAISQPRSKSCLMESIQRVTEINHHILNEPSVMERIYIFLFKDNTETIQIHWQWKYTPYHEWAFRDWMH